MVPHEVQRAQVEASSNCLLLSSLCCLGPAEEAGIGDTPNLEDQAAGHVTQGQWSKPPLGDSELGRRELGALSGLYLEKTY